MFNARVVPQGNRKEGIDNYTFCQQLMAIAGFLGRHPEGLRRRLIELLVLPVLRPRDVRLEHQTLVGELVDRQGLLG